MKTNSTTLATQIAYLLDEKDKKGKDGRIEASIWNAYVADKGGKTIQNYINLNAAIRSLATYLYRQAKEKGIFIKKLGQDWIDAASTTAPNTQKKNQEAVVTKR